MYLGSVADSKIAANGIRGERRVLDYRTAVHVLDYEGSGSWAYLDLSVAIPVRGTSTFLQFILIVLIATVSMTLICMLHRFRSKPKFTCTVNCYGLLIRYRL